MNRTSLILIACLAIAGCHADKLNKQDAAIGDSSIVDNVSYAKGFSLTSQGRNKVLKVMNPWQNASGVEFSYILSDTLESSEIVDEYSSLIKVPVHKVICLSTTHIGFINFLGRINTVSGISGKNYVVNDDIRIAIDKGLIADVGYDENLNYELILKLKPDLVFAYGVNVAITSTVKKLNELGIPVVLIGEYLEQEPLAKMEWIKVFAALYGQSKLAELEFDSTVVRYNKLVEMAAGEPDKPTVLLGLPWRGTWYISGSKSYSARLIEDAGGKYLWDHLDFNESRPLGLEKIYENALTADYWLNTGEARSKNDIISVDERFTNLLSYRNGNLYNNDNQLTKYGGNDFFEMGVIEPEIILSDLICILHPHLLPSYRLKYYRKLQ